MAPKRSTSSGRPRRRGNRSDSANSAVDMSSWGRRSTVAPSRPPMHISARATARPPSLTSWHDRTRPARIARGGCGSAAGASGSGCGTAPGVGRLRRARGRGGCRRTRSRRAEEDEHVAGRGELGGDACAGVGDVADGGDHQRRWHGVARAVGAGVLVVQRVLARDERRAVGDGCVVAPVDGGDQLAERRRAARVAPREVVEQRDAVGVGADGDDVADRLVDHGVGHRLGVVEAVPRVDADADGQPVGVAGSASTTPSAGASPSHADERAHGGAAADLVVVAVDRRRLRGDVRVGEQGEQRGRRVVDACARRLPRSAPAIVAVIRRCGRPSCRKPCRGRARRRRRGARRAGRRR